MPLARFRKVVAQALDSIPPEIRRRIDNVAIVVEDAPSKQTLRGFGLDPERDTLFGLYQGVPLSKRSSLGYSALPDRITIYYLPLTDAYDDEYHLKREIRRTVIHEVGHHFGLSDKRIREMGY